MGFLLTVSFLIHGLSLFCIILLYMQVTKVKRIERLHQQNINKMEAAMGSYLAEFQEQNEQFLRTASNRAFHFAFFGNGKKQRKITFGR